MEKLRRTALLALVLAFAATYALGPVDDNDIFFHVRVGDLIRHDHAVPRTDTFTGFGQGKPYVAYAWVFQVLVAAVHGAAGWTGIAVLTAALSVAVAFAVHRLVARRGAGFTHSAAITGVALVAILRMISPRSWLFTILFLAVELDLVLAARETKDDRKLLWLLPLFMIWANVHIQFVYGLAVLGLLGIERLVERDRPLPLLAIGVGCTLATLVNPYGLGLWATVLEYANAKGAYAVINEHAPLAFRSLHDWCVLGLALGAAVTLGWTRERRVFPYLLLAFSALLSFRSGRDGFVVVLASAALIARALAREPREVFPASRAGWLPVLGVAAGFLIAVALGRRIDEKSQDAAIARSFPADAAAAVERLGIPGPVFNDYDWGSYLIWRLPGRLVAIDGRTNLHGDERIERSREVWSGAPGWEKDEDLERSNVVVAARAKPLTALLKRDPRFRLVYEDEQGVASVFSRCETR
jgi:hypothetical protein